MAVEVSSISCQVWSVHLIGIVLLLPTIQTSAEGICQTHDIVYLSARNEEELYKNLDKLFNSEEGPVLLEVFTNAEEDAQALKDYYQAF